MIPRFEPPIGYQEILAALAPTGLDDIAAFEADFARVMGQKHAVMFPYGRTGLVALLRSLGIENREVLCPAYTCVVVPNAVVTAGNHPVFIDSGRDGNARIQEALGYVNERTGALIATSIFGNPVDLDALASFQRDAPHVPIIQDCAHSFICEWKGRPVHREGVAAIFGLNVSKTMTSIFGGMVTSDDTILDARLRKERESMLRPSGWQKTMQRFAYALAVGPAFWPPLFAVTDRLRRAGLLDRFTRYYDEERIDMPSDYLCAMTPLEARVGRVQTRKLADMISARRAYDAHYRERLADIPGLAWIEKPEGSSVSHVAARVAERDSVRRRAALRGIELGEVIEYSVPELAAYRSHLGEGRSFPVAKVLSETTVNFPTALRFDRRKADKVVMVMRDLLQDAGPVPSLPLV